MTRALLITDWDERTPNSLAKRTRHLQLFRKNSEAKDKQKRLEDRRLREQEESLAGKPVLIALGFTGTCGGY